LLRELLADGVGSVYSHQLAGKGGVTSAQVRRDLMYVGYSGSPNKGYDTKELAEGIDALLDPPQAENVCLVGVGNLGRAILAHCAGRCGRLSITAAFDKDPAISGRVVHGCRCYSIDEAPRVIAMESIRSAILAVPGEEAQKVTDLLLSCGVRGLLSFSPRRLRVPLDVCVENMDVTIALEKVAFFARKLIERTERRNG
jgi:redox-sensing transcriptional repressor